MSRTFARIISLAAAAGALVAGRLGAAEPEWSFAVTPYLWVAGVALDTSLPGQQSTSPDAARFETRIAAGAMVAAQARYRSVGLFTDFAWLRLKTEALTPGPAYSEVQLQSDFIHSTAALTYRLPLEGKFHAEVLAGARLWHVANDFKVTSGALPGFDAGADKTWADPMVGASLSYDFWKRWSADVKGMVGGFGIAAEIAGEVFAGVSYRFTRSCSATLGYRYLHEEYDRDRFALNLDAQGFLLGVGFHF